MTALFETEAFVQIPGQLTLAAPKPEAPQTVVALKRWLEVGTRIRVTNHYIDVEDHPCYGTRETVVLVNGATQFATELLHPECPDGRSWVSWPKRTELRTNEDGSVTFMGGGCAQGADEPFLTISRV